MALLKWEAIVHEQAQRHRCSEVRRFGGSEVQRFRGSEAQRLRGSEFRGSELQRFRGSDVQRFKRFPNVGPGCFTLASSDDIGSNG